MTSLDETYRRLLRWYPRSWRARNGDVLLGTLLGVAEAQGRSLPARGEAASIRVHGSSARLDLLVEPAVRNAASTVALTLGAGLAAASFVMGTWVPWGTRGPGLSAYPSSAASLLNPSLVLAVLWLAALALAVGRRWLVGRVVLGLSLVFTAVTALAPEIFFGDRPTLVFLSACALLAVIGRPAGRNVTALAALGWAAVAVVLFLGSFEWSAAYPQTSSLWGAIAAIWYAAAATIVVAVGLAVARLWRAGFTIILALVPLTTTFVVARLTGDLYENGSALMVALPVALGVVLLVLSSSGRLDLRPSRRGTALD
ncbi:hypothetical protein [Frondihabitans peucedani]|uniref:Uncharacterized protein n=1 Tax=Frondihabitans peucedani TaxID=598626 RepID=A0ABP8DZC0_9MICO